MQIYFKLIIFLIFWFNQFINKLYSYAVFLKTNITHKNIFIQYIYY